MVSMDFEMELSSEGFHYIKAFKTFPQHSRPEQSLVGKNNDDIDAACGKDDYLAVQDFEGDFEVLPQVSILHVWRQRWSDQP